MNLEEAKQQIIQCLKQEPSVQFYQQLEKQIQAHNGLQRAQEQLEEAQKQRANALHVDKPKAARAWEEKANTYQVYIDTHPLVEAYREAIQDAEALLVQLTKYIEQKMNQ